MRTDLGSVRTLSDMVGNLEDMKLNWKPDKWIAGPRHLSYIMEERKTHQTKTNKQATTTKLAE